MATPSRSRVLGHPADLRGVFHSHNVARTPQQRARTPTKAIPRRRFPTPRPEGKCPRARALGRGPMPPWCAAYGIPRRQWPRPHVGPAPRGERPTWGRTGSLGKSYGGVSPRGCRNPCSRHPVGKKPHPVGISPRSLPTPGSYARSGFTPGPFHPGGVHPCGEIPTGSRSGSGRGEIPPVGIDPGPQSPRPPGSGSEQRRRCDDPTDLFPGGTSRSGDQTRTTLPSSFGLGRRTTLATSGRTGCAA